MVTPLPFREPTLIWRGAKYSLADDIWKVDTNAYSLTLESTATGDWVAAHASFEVAATEAKRWAFCSLELAWSGLARSGRDSDCGLSREFEIERASLSSRLPRIKRPASPWATACASISLRLASLPRSSLRVAWSLEVTRWCSVAEETREWDLRATGTAREEPWFAARAVPRSSPWNASRYTWSALPLECTSMMVTGRERSSGRLSSWVRLEVSFSESRPLRPSVSLSVACGFEWLGEFDWTKGLRAILLVVTVPCDVRASC